MSDHKFSAFIVVALIIFGISFIRQMNNDIEVDRATPLATPKASITTTPATQTDCPQVCQLQLEKERFQQESEQWHARLL